MRWGKGIVTFGVAVLGLWMAACNGGAPHPPPSTTTVMPPPEPSECNATERIATRALTPVDRLERARQRIVGGDEAQPGAWPWATALAFRTFGGELFQYCGGSLIAPNWVLTAAHCEVEVGDIAILGRHDLRTDAGEEIIIDRVLTHSDFNERTQDNDISLAHLNRPSSEETIALGDAVEGDPVAVIGWGALRQGGDTSPTLQQVEVVVTNQAQCNDAYDGEITENMICAGLPEGGRDSCQGDSGGPLMKLGSDGWRHVGIVSFGFGCAVPNFPGVNTRTSSYAGWVEACTR